MSFAQYGLGYPGLSAPQMMVGSGMQPNSHTPTCDVAHARPFMADPHTGQTICSCQYDRFMRSCFPSPTSAGFAPFPSTPGNDHPAGMPPGMGPYHPGSNHPSHDSISMYAAAGLSGPFSDPKDPGCDNAAAAAWRAAIVAQNGASAAACYPYDPSFGGAGMYSSGPYCGNNFSMDPAGLNRRKNATRETTSQLKHWLSEHRKNPYPTKGEKIMLAIVTKMTLTQVSTWFANARRRLKKENKMTWSPRNRGCEDDDKSDDQGGNDDDPDDFPDKDDESLSVTGSLTEDDVKRPDSLSPSVSDSKDHIQNQIQSATPTTLTSSTPLNASSKPRIWSLADLAAAPAPVPPQTQSATKSHLSTNPQLDACPPFPFTTQQMSVQTSNSNQQNHGHAAYFGRTGAGPGGPMMGPGGPGMHARPPLPGWPGLFPGSVVAAATASSIMQSNSLINAHHAGTFFSRNPNSAFSAPGQGFPGSLGLSLPHSNPMPRPVNRISSRNSTVEIEKSDNGEPQVKRRSSSTDKVMLRDSSSPSGDKTGSPLAGRRQSSHSPIDVIVPADVNAKSTVTGSPTLHNSKKRKRSSSSDNSVVSA